MGKSSGIGLGLLQALPYLVTLVSVASYLRYVVQHTSFRTAHGDWQTYERSRVS